MAVGSKMLASGPKPGDLDSGLWGHSPIFFPHGSWHWPSLFPRIYLQPQHLALITAGRLATREPSTYGSKTFVGPLKNLLKARVPLIQQQQKKQVHTSQNVYNKVMLLTNPLNPFAVFEPQVKKPWSQSPPVIDKVRGTQRGMFTGARSHSMTSCLLIQTSFTLFQHPPPIKWPIIRPTREMGERAY